MSWRTGATIFWKLWPIVKEHEPQGEFRDEFVKDLLKLFLHYDCDPGDFKDIDPDIHRFMNEVDPEIPGDEIPPEHLP